MLITIYGCLLNRSQNTCGLWQASPRSEWGGRGCPSCIYRTPNLEEDGVTYEEAELTYEQLLFVPPDLDNDSED